MKALSRLLTRRRPIPSPLRVQILSDLHLEVGQQYSSYTFPVSAAFLILAGDIGRLVDYDQYLNFLKRLVSRYDRIFLILGNHEFYGLDYESGLEKAQTLEQEPSLEGKVILLHRARWDDPHSGLTILGCTLWSAIPEAAHDIVKSKVNDFKKITGWSVQKHNELHVDEVAWLRKQIYQVTSQDMNNARETLVVTHHAPCLEGTSSPQHTNNPWTPAFATDLITQEGWNRVKAWVFGHTHYSTDFIRNGIRVISNQRGYVLPGRTEQSGKGDKKHNRYEFDPAMAITI